MGLWAFGVWIGELDLPDFLFFGVYFVSYVP